MNTNPKCPNCGSKSYKHGRKSTNQRYRCSKCKTTFLIKYKDLHKEGNPNWKGENTKKETGRDRANRWFKIPKGFERHHIDGNPLNNNPENIAILTRSEHMKTDGRLKNLKRGDIGLTRDKLGRYMSGKKQPQYPVCYNCYMKETGT